MGEVKELLGITIVFLIIAAIGWVAALMDN
jgi:hypothetical protein